MKCLFCGKEMTNWDTIFWTHDCHKEKEKEDNEK